MWAQGAMQGSLRYQEKMQETRKMCSNVPLTTKRPQSKIRQSTRGGIRRMHHPLESCSRSMGSQTCEGRHTYRHTEPVRGLRQLKARCAKRAAGKIYAVRNNKEGPKQPFYIYKLFSQIVYCTVINNKKTHNFPHYFQMNLLSP